jgi:hypothetical protein
MSGEWREQWEWHADQESERYDAMRVPRLVEVIRRGHVGDYHTIWYALARRASLSDAADVLLGVLGSERPYLERYHAAAALLELLQSREFGPEELSAGRFPLAENLVRVRALVTARLRGSSGD